MRYRGMQAGFVMQLRRVLVLMFILSSSNSFAATLHHSGYDWFTLKSEHFYLHYHEGLEEIARATLSLAEQVHLRLTTRLNWNPTSRTHVVLTDEYDFSNGFATPLPNNFTTIFITPPDDLISLEDHAGWIETVFTHEYTHILHLDKADEMPEKLRGVVGRHPLAFPNQYQPRWLIEGYATYIETDKKRGIGRGQSSLYAAMMRAEILGGFKPLRMVNGPMASWPSGTAAYLYGVYYHQFLEETYGKGRIEMMIQHNSNNILPFAINRAASSTFGKDLDQLWDDFEVYVNKKFQPQMGAIRKKGLLEGRRLTHDGYFTGPLKVLANGEAYYISYNGERETSLMKIDKNKNVEHLADVHSGARLDVHPKSGVLLSQLEICGAGQAYADLYRLALDGGGLERLTNCARYRNAIWSPDGKEIIAVKYAKGVTELNLLDEWGKLKQVLWQGRRWDVVGGLDWSPTKKELIAAVYREQGGWNLERFDLQSHKWTYVLKDAAIVGYPQYTDDGRYVLFTSEHGGVYNIRRMDTQSGKIETITNVLTGALSPAQTAEGDLFYVGYTGEGLDVFHLASTDIKPTLMPKVAKGTTGEPLPTPAVVVPQSVERYSAWDSLKPAWWMPWIYSDTDRTEVSVITAGYDSLLQHIYAANIGYDTANNWWLGQFGYIYDGLYPTIIFDVSRDHEFTYAINNNANKKVRRTTEQKMEIMFPFRGMSSNWSFNLAAFQHESEDIVYAVDPEPGVPNDTDPQPDEIDYIAGVALVYDSTNRHIKSVSRSQGRAIALVAEDSDAISGSNYSGQVSWLDWREFIRLGGEHVFALRYVEGKGTKTTRPFRLGGSKESESLTSSVTDPIFSSPFNKRSYNLRGYPEGLAQLRGQNMQLASAEYRFPLALVERGFMAPPVGMHQIHGTLFYDIGASWSTGSSPEKYYRGAGVEIGFDTSLFYFGVINITAGYAHGFDADGENQTYVRIGAAF